MGMNLKWGCVADVVSPSPCCARTSECTASCSRQFLLSMDPLLHAQGFLWGLKALLSLFKAIYICHTECLHWQPSSVRWVGAGKSMSQLPRSMVENSVTQFTKFLRRYPWELIPSSVLVMICSVSLHFTIFLFQLSHLHPSPYLRVCCHRRSN